MKGIRALADYGYYNNKNTAELSGNVTIQQGQQLISADKVILDIQGMTAHAQGKVTFTDTLVSTDATKNNGMLMVADNVEYKTNTGEAIVNDVAFASLPMQAHGYAKTINKVGEQEYQLNEVTFSTCPPNFVSNASTPKGGKETSAVNQENIKKTIEISTRKNTQQWQIDADSITLNEDTGRGEAYNTTLKIKGVPVVYLPYFNFPIDDNRASGFLTPNIRLNTQKNREGIEIETPYYFNIAKNVDATVTPHLFTNRNPMLSTELRYLTKSYGDGKITATFLPQDKKYHTKDRSSIYLTHNWQSASIPNLSANIEFNKISDTDYINHFDYSGTTKNQLNLPRNIKVDFENNNIDAQLKFENYQRLEAVDNDGQRITDQNRPYSRLPQVSIKYALPKWSELELTANKNNNPSNINSIVDNFKVVGVYDSAYFKKKITDDSAIENSGFRMYNSLQASYPINKYWGYIKPSIKLQHLFSTYDKDASLAKGIEKDERSQSIFVPQFTLDTQAQFIKKGTPIDIGRQSSKGYQILSPRLKYIYAPYQSQNDIPNFDTSTASVSYEQLYSDSWFLGYDRIQDLHSITPGLNYRYIDAIGQTRLNANIAQQYYLDKGAVTLDDNTQLINIDGSYHVQPKSINKAFSKSSGIVSTLSIQPYDNVWLDMNGAVDSSYNMSYLTGQLRYQPSVDSQFGIGFVERKLDNNTKQLPISAITGSAMFPINDNWHFLSQAQYDYRSNKLLDSMIGINYEDCCLGFSVYGRHQYEDIGINTEGDDTVRMELRLKGISQNNKLKKIISDKIIAIN